MKRDSILPEKDVTSFLKDACLSKKMLRLFKLPTQLNIKITLHGTSPLSLLPLINSP